MRSSTTTLAVILLALSSVSARPYTVQSSTHTQLSTPLSTHFSRRSYSHRDKVLSKASRSHLKRSSFEHNQAKYHEAHKRADDGKTDSEDSDDEDDCTDSDDSSSEEGYDDDPSDHTPYRIGHNSSLSAVPPTSLASLSDSSHQLHSNSEKHGHHQSTTTVTQPKQSEDSSASHESSGKASKGQSHDDDTQHNAHSSSGNPGPSSQYSAYSSYHSSSHSSHQDQNKSNWSSYGGYHGKATFFAQGGNPGACGKVHQDSDFVVAIQSAMYGDGKYCGKSIVVTRKSTGKSIICTAADECPSCETDQSLDLSKAAFNALGDPDEGIFDIHWKVLG